MKKDERVSILEIPIKITTLRGVVWASAIVYSCRNINTAKHFIEILGCVVYRGERYAAQIEKIISGKFQFPKMMLRRFEKEVRN